MSDFRIQRAINAASNACSDALDKAFKQQKNVSKSALAMELMRNYNVTPRSAKEIVDIAVTGRYEGSGDILTPIGKKARA